MQVSNSLDWFCWENFQDTPDTPLFDGQNPWFLVKMPRSPPIDHFAEGTSMTSSSRRPSMLQSAFEQPHGGSDAEIQRILMSLKMAVVKTASLGSKVCNLYLTLLNIV